MYGLNKAKIPALYASVSQYIMWEDNEYLFPTAGMGIL